MKATSAIWLLLNLASATAWPAFADAADGWQVLYEEDHEAARLGARLWGGIGASGPSGASFARVTGRTSSHFDGGWQSYELGLGAGGTLRETYFWLLHRLDGAPAHDRLRFRCDFMGDATIQDVNVAFEFFGGKESGGLGLHLLTVGVGGGVLRVGRETVADFAPHVWYRLELDLRHDQEAGRLVGTATVRAPGRAEPHVVELALPCNPAALALRNLKLAKGRRRDAPAHETRFYLDNLHLAVIRRSDKPVDKP